MIKVYCDNCKKLITGEPKSIQMDVFDVDNERIKTNDHERYYLDLCPCCHRLFRQLVKGTGVKPSVNPYG